MKLRSCLDQCSLALLRQIAQHHAVVLAEPPARGEVIGELCDRILVPGYLDRFVQRLTPDERHALLIVAAGDGRAPGFVVDRRLRQRLPPDQAEAGAARVLAELQAAGLLFRVFQAAGAERGEFYLLPDELLQVMPDTPSAVEAPLAAASEPAEQRAGTPLLSLFALASFLRRFRQRDGSAGAEGQLAALARETGELTLELPGRSPRERWTLLAHLALSLGIFRREEAGLEPTDGFDTWLGLGPVAERRLWDAYVSADRWNDLERSGSGGGRYVGRTTEPRQARAELFRRLRSLPTETWLRAADVERQIREHSPDFLRQGFEVASARLLDLESGEVLGGEVSWERVEGPMVRYVLTGPLYWLGAAEWGRGEDAWDRLRLTSRAATWLAGSDEALSSGSAPLLLTDERRVVCEADSDLQTLWQLEPYLGLGRWGPPAEYALTRTSFARGIEAGGSAPELRQLLERAAYGPLPAAFRQAIERWSARAGRFRIRPTVVLHAEETAELDDVLERLRGSGLLHERLGPRAASVAAARVTELAAALERLGHLPDVDASLRLMAGRRAYAALVDQETLAALLWAIRFARTLDPALTLELADPERLARRLEQALGLVAGPRISRRARAAARRLRPSRPLQTETSRPIDLADGIS